jgi:hypothetical protein
MAKKGTLFGKPRGEVIKHPGAFSAKAKEAGRTTQQEINAVLGPASKASATTKKQAGLAKAFATMRAKKGGK